MDTIDEMGTCLCCVCGINIQPNPSYRCLPCLRQAHDISSEIPKEVTIYSCRGCDRYLNPPANWIIASFQSKEMLSFCLKRLRGLEKVNLVTATFLYTEPHSKRIKVQLVVQKEVEGGAALQQTFDVEYTIAHQFCTDCHRIEAKDFWKATVQVRQKVEHKRTFYYLEQLLMKNNLTSRTSSFKMINSGLDLFFASDNEAKKMVEFIASSVVCKRGQSKKLISHDVKSNIFNHKFTYCVELAPVCKDSLVCLPRSLARSLGGISPVSIVLRATRQIVLIDPNTAQMAEINALAYYKNPFIQLCTSKQLTEFYVMDIEETDVRYFAGQGQISHKHTVCDVWVQRTSDIGTDKQKFCRTHLGGLLNIGDKVVGYDLQNCNLNNDELDKLKDNQIPDVVLIKKYYGSKTVRNRHRKWKLKTMRGANDSKIEDDFNDFLEDIEEDPALRKNINIYKQAEKSTAPASAMADDEDYVEDAPVVSIEEMLDELTLDDVPMQTTEEEEEDDEEWQDADEQQ